MSDIHDLLERAAGDVVPSPDLEDRVATSLHRRERQSARRRLLVAAAVVVLAGLAAVAVAVAQEGDDPAQPVIAGPSPSTTEAVPAGSSVAPAPAPDQLGAARWEQLEAPPLLDDREGVTWAAGERYLLIFGGSVDRAADAPLADGAVFDIRTGRWRMIGPFPGVAGRAGAGAVVDGDVAWLVGGRLSPSDGGDTGAISGEVVRIDLSAGTAVVVADSDRAARTYPVVAVADGRLVVTGGRRADAYDRATSVLDLAAGTWTDGDDLPWDTVSDEFFGSPGTAIAAPDADGVLLGRHVSDDDPRFELARLAVPAGTVTALPSMSVAPVGLVGPEMRLLPADDGLVIAQEVVDTRVFGVDPAATTPRWSATAPASACEGPMDTAAAGGSVVVRGPCDQETVGVDPATGTTVSLPSPPTETGRLVAVGDVLLSVDLGSPADAPDGEGARPAGTAALVATPPPTPEPQPVPTSPTSPTDLAGASAGRWQEVSTAPFALGRREGAAGAASDRYLLTWGGRTDGEPGALADGAVFDLATGAWRRIEAAAGVVGRWGATAAIDGDVAWVVGGSSSTSDGRQAPPIGEVLRIDLTTGVTTVAATDERAARLVPAVAVREGAVVVAGGRVRDEDALGIAAFDLESESWRDGPDLPWGTRASDYSAYDPNTAIAAAGPEHLVIARRTGEADAPRLQYARLDLTTLAPSASGLVRVPPGTALDEVAVIAGDRTVVLSDQGGIQADGFDGSEVAWSVQLPLGTCNGPVAGQPTTSGIAYVGVCGEGTFLDPVDGRTAPVPDVPTVDGSGVTVAGDRILVVTDGPDGRLVVWVLVA